MEKDMLGNDVVTQIGIIVHDIEKTAKAYADFLGQDMPAITVTGTYEQCLTEFYGRPTAARAKLAFLHVGGKLDIELIEPDMNESVWREFLVKRGEGVQHIAFVIDGMKELTEKLQRSGMPLTMRGEYTGGRFAYFDTMKDLKVDIELLENDK